MVKEFLGSKRRGLDPAIHDKQNVDARHKAGHDDDRGSDWKHCQTVSFSRVILSLV